MRIELAQVGKRYGRDWVLRGIDLQMEASNSYAVTGPNGSGKSTLLRILAGHLTPGKGRIAFFQGQQPIPATIVYKHLAYAAPYIELIEELTLTEALQFHARFKPFASGITTPGLIELAGLQKSAHKPIRHFSSGMKQRVKLAMAICSPAPLLLLDEPTTNLDEQGTAWYLQLMSDFAAGRLIVVASNLPLDYSFCTAHINILDYKTKQQAANG